MCRAGKNVQKKAQNLPLQYIQGITVSTLITFDLVVDLVIEADPLLDAHLQRQVSDN